MIIVSIKAAVVACDHRWHVTAVFTTTYANHLLLRPNLGVSVNTLDILVLATHCVFILVEIERGFRNIHSGVDSLFNINGFGFIFVLNSNDTPKAQKKGKKDTQLVHLPKSHARQITVISVR